MIDGFGRQWSCWAFPAEAVGEVLKMIDGFGRQLELGSSIRAGGARGQALRTAEPIGKVLKMIDGFGRLVGGGLEKDRRLWS